MLSINYPKIENKSYLNLELSLIEPMHKLNLRGKNREFFTKVGKQLSIMLPVESNRQAILKQFVCLTLMF